MNAVGSSSADEDSCMLHPLRETTLTLFVGWFSFYTNANSPTLKNPYNASTPKVLVLSPEHLRKIPHSYAVEEFGKNCDQM